ncbi:MAG TPA: hypothetical protein VFU42_05835 [Candidatus Deferrimicrobiaceae bacterium]|nr:hypothetical protein [Candidatus Deferrimicrobiaceae bacterium]
MIPRAVASFIPFLVLLVLFPCVPADATGASPDAPPTAVTVLHTANGLGELSPCG